MKDAIEGAIQRLTESVTAEGKHGETMQLTQAILNLTHALATLDGVKG